MTTTLMPVPKQQYFGTAGLPLVGGKIYTYAAGTNNPKPTYTDAAGTVPQANPITLNVRGEPDSPIFWSGAYKVEVRDVIGNLVYTVDNYNTDPAGLWGIFASFAASSGASLMGWIQSAAGAVATTVAKWISRQPRSVFDFLTEDQIADVQANTAAINLYPQLVKAITAAGNGTLIWPAGTYLNATATLVQPSGQKWQGEGGQRATTIKKGFNGDLVSVGTLGEIIDINLDGQGANYTGRGFYVPAGFSQRLERCRAQNCKGPALEFAVDQGGGAHVSDFEGNTIDQTTVPAIKLAGDTGPHPRFFDGIWLSGGLFELGLGAGNGCSMTNFYIRNFITSGLVATGAQLFHVSNGRVASIADTTTFSGSDLEFSTVAFSGPVALVNAQGMKFSACSFAAGITEDPTNCQYNSWDNQASAYAATWTQNGATPPTIGNGSLTTWYVRQGYLCTVSGRLVIGSTTTTGDGASAYQFSLPFRGHQAINQRGFICTLYDASAATDFLMEATIGANQNTFTLGRNGQGMRLGSPIELAAGDTVDFQFTYLCR